MAGYVFFYTIKAEFRHCPEPIGPMSGRRVEVATTESERQHYYKLVFDTQLDEAFLKKETKKVLVS